MKHADRTRKLSMKYRKDDLGLHPIPDQEFEPDSPERSNNGEQMCPFVPDPRPACYCFNLTRQNQITHAIHYCQNHFGQCDIFKSLMKKEQSNRQVENQKGKGKDGFDHGCGR
jgi:hypothetical protein